ncbi:J domain-containing protein [Pseudomonas glycinae]|uniref:J domain-containing protein n=1 Tax=Pseudomonas glycinae TaxID=1785145 RepID=UPI0018D73DAE|nr:J domain-containing protein [Pseudomonas glycinae]MBH3405064.1 J domain-containing protein [Pseudomonas glycinae]
MECWSVLQLPEDAGLRDIKRSYARLLKVFRPDEDAAGFQRLREAYERALSIAQWRLDNEETEEHGDVMLAPEIAALAVQEQSMAQPLQKTGTDAWDYPAALFEPVTPAAPEAPLESQTLRVQPLNPEPLNLEPEQPTADPAIEAASQLLNGLSDTNLDQRWEQARQQDCAQAFQELLLTLSFEQPALRLSIARWAVQHLGWLGPWQEIVIGDGQRSILANELLADYRQSLETLLASQSEREFLALLKTYTAQPWLQVFDRREHWQQIVLQLLQDTEWSVPLFDRVSQLFGWDDTKGIHPQPDWLWQEMIERCNQESLYDTLCARAEDQRNGTPDALAARMLISPMKPRQHKDMTDRFIPADWQACQQLSETLKWRFPDLLARLPYADVFYWRRFLPRYIAAETWLRSWAAIALALWLFYLPAEHKTTAMSIVIPLAFACVPVWFFRIGLSYWFLISAHLIVQDLWLTERIIPRRWNPDTRWLVLRHGVPQAVMILLFSVMLGGLGAFTYIGVILIGLWHKRRIGTLDPEFSDKHPWLTALHWAHFSPLQLLFLVVMTGVILASQLGYSLKHLFPG